MLKARDKSLNVNKEPYIEEIKLEGLNSIIKEV